MRICKPNLKCHVLRLITPSELICVYSLVSPCVVLESGGEIASFISAELLLAFDTLVVFHNELSFVNHSEYALSPFGYTLEHLLVCASLIIPLYFKQRLKCTFSVVTGGFKITRAKSH